MIHLTSSLLDGEPGRIFVVQPTTGLPLQQLRPEQEQRLREVKSELAKRFEFICSDMSSEEFANLVDEMARFRVKYEDLEAELVKRASKS